MLFRSKRIKGDWFQLHLHVVGRSGGKTGTSKTHFGFKVLVGTLDLFNS